MEEGKKGFFEALEPKSAVIVGVAGGFLALCAIGFFILGYFAITRGFGAGPNGQAVAQAGQNTPADTQTAEPAQQVDAAASANPSDKPVVELFVMSYCPYGLQMEKAFLPVMELLKNKAAMSIRFVSYSMHEKKEIDENTRQYCIQKEQNAKYIAYLKCFTAKGDPDACVREAAVSQSSLSACMTSADRQFGITAKYEDKSSWLGGQYPVYPIDVGLNAKYKVEGSPTLVINGAQVNAGRSPEAVKQAVCAAFKTAPSECSKTLSADFTSAGFGEGTGGGTTAGCGS